jgi:hypothetical protein
MFFLFLLTSFDLKFASESLQLSNAFKQGHNHMQVPVWL